MKLRAWCILGACALLIASMLVVTVLALSETHRRTNGKRKRALLAPFESTTASAMAAAAWP